MTQGNATSYTVTIGALNGFTGTVNLMIGGVPSNATASFSPATVTGSGSTTLDVLTTANTAHRQFHADHHGDKRRADTIGRRSTSASHAAPDFTIADVARVEHCGSRAEAPLTP